MSILPLLYDDLIERATTRGFRSAPLTQHLLSAQVYELTDVVPLAMELTRGKSAQMMKRPPGDNLWVEWRSGARPNGRLTFDCVTGGQDGIITTGAWMNRAVPGTEEHQHIVEAIRNAASEPDVVDKYPVVFVSHLFHRIDSLGDHTPQEQTKLRDAVGMVASVGHVVVEMMDESGVMGISTKGENQGHLPQIIRRIFTDTFLPDAPGNIDGYDPTDVLWPAMLSFAMLHCRNIVTEKWTPSPTIQKSRKRAGKPARTSYRTLRIEVPTQTVRRSDTPANGDEESGPKMRLHLCRGHMRHLQSDVFKEKKGQWVFVPAHLRGSKELGEVTGPRKLVQGKNGE